MSIAKELLEKIESVKIESEKSESSEGKELFLIGYDKDGNQVISQSGPISDLDEYLENRTGKYVAVMNWNRVVPSLFLLQATRSNRQYVDSSAVYIHGRNLGGSGIHKIEDKKLIKELVDELNTGTRTRTDAIDSVLAKMLKSVG